MLYMITKQQVVLTTNKHQLFLERFEAIQYAKELSDIQNIWKKNKTPVIISNQFCHLDIVSYQLIEIPEELIREDKIDDFIDFCHHHEFECGEYRTGEIYDTKFERCFLCEMARHKGFESLAKYNQFVEKPVDCIIYESENFFVIPTLGQFIPGYLLIIPHQHIMSNAELDNITRQELLDVMEDIKYILKLTYDCSKVLVWENGTGNSGQGKAKDSVVHAHTHIAPSYLTPLDIKKMSGFKFQEISTKELSAFNQHSYLLIKDINDKWLINNDSNVYIPRQYIRQLLANEYKIPGEQWNWREYPFKDQIYQTHSDILTCLAENWDKLPERIKSNTKKYVKKF